MLLVYKLQVHSPRQCLRRAFLQYELHFSFLQCFSFILGVQSPGSGVLPIAIVPPVLFAVVILISVLLCCICRCQKRKTVNRTSPPNLTHDSGINQAGNSQTCGQDIPLVTSQSSDWQWCNDQGGFSYYSSDVSNQLTSAFRSDPKGTIQIQINSSPYTIDFASMQQVNLSTGHVRRIKTSIAVDVQWVYKDGQTFHPYTALQSKAIESMYQQRNPHQLAIGDNQYTFDFDQMCQINVSSLFKRPIERRLAAATVQSSAEIPAVDATLAPRTESAVHMHVVGIPDNMTRELEKKIRHIARINDVTCLFQEELFQGQVTKVLKLEGVNAKLQGAYNTIQGELLKFRTNSEPAHNENVEFPEHWQPQTSTTELFPVTARSEEWQRVHSKFSSTMKSSLVQSITRIQNKWIWEKYVVQKKRLNRKNGGRVNEKELFHGTRGNDPKMIYEGEDGFDMRYGLQGMWGVANYFAVNASYSHNYAYSSTRGKQIFLATVLTGDSHECPSNGNLRMPPTKQSSGATGGGNVQITQMKYDTVTGHTGGSQVFMTYDNDKAYPAYLITYK